MCGLLCGCGNLPEPYAPPTQRPLFETPPESPRILNMRDADAESHFVNDISRELDGDTWRWTGKRPTIRLRTDPNQELVYSIDFTIAGATFEHTGPVTVSLFVNDHFLDRVRYTSPGRHRIEKRIPASLMGPGEELTLAAEIDKLWTPPLPGATPLGFILVALGLEQQSLEPHGLGKK